jgi:hypothetical protein
MSTPTVAVTCIAYDQNGNPVAGGRFTAKLSQTEVYNGFVVPEQVIGVADANGVCVLDLWPNALGVSGSSYLVTAVNPDTGRTYLRTTAVVPNSACNLHEIIVAAPFPPIDASEQALIAAQGALAPVTAQAAAAAASASNAASSASAAATSASGAATSASTATTQAGIATTQAGVATTQAGTATTQAGTATTQAGIATTQAGIATTQAGTATTQAGIATTKASESAASATTATTQAGVATTKASEAAASAINASNSAYTAGLSIDAAVAAKDQAVSSASAAAGSATAASNSATAASTSNTSAATAASTATTQAGIATTQAGLAVTAANTASTKANEASASASNAASSVAAVTTQAGIATTQAGIATAQATAAAASAVEADASVDAIQGYSEAAVDAATAAAASQTSASSSATSAQTSATTATTQAGIATTKASEAAASASSVSAAAATATEQANIATAQASAASASASAASTSASEADTDATIAANAATTATAQANNSTGSASVATTQADIATTQADIATTQAGIATTQAGIATTQAGIATTGASTATTQAGIATTGASTATTQADIATAGASTATTQATSATNSASAASASAAAALASQTASASSAAAANTSAGDASGSAASALAIYGTAAAQQTALANAQAAASQAAGSAASAASVVQQDLSGVNAAALHRSPNAVTAMFLYDTSKDSDGGAWTDRCEHTSWYNEAVTGKWLGAQPSETNARHEGATLGTELVTNGDFSNGTTGWTSGQNAILSASGGILIVTNGVNSNWGEAKQTVTTVVGRVYQVTWAPIGGGTGTLYVNLPVIGDVLGSVGRAVFTATSTASVITVKTGNAAQGITVLLDNISVREVTALTTASNDYFQLTTDGKFYRLWKNLLKYSEQFDNAVWSKSGTTATAGLISETATTGEHHVIQAISDGNVFTVEVKESGRDYIRLFIGTSTATSAVTYRFSTNTFSAIGSEITPTSEVLADGYVRITIVSSVVRTQVRIMLLEGSGTVSYAGDITKGVFARRSQAERGTTATAYEAKGAEGSTSETFRGNKRKFPKLAGIVAEAASVTIYDLTEPGRPMWMRISGSTIGTGGVTGNALYVQGGYNLAGVAALNGNIAAHGNVISGVSLLDFPADKATIRYQYFPYGVYRGGIAQRHQNLGFNALTANAAPVSPINAVAMTVLPDAPVDPVTGLKVPTIAVATAGGISVIQHSGVVRNSSSTVAYTKLILDEKEVGAVYGSGFAVASNPGQLGVSFALTNYTTASVPALMGVPTVVA